jgi:hypothetical protein
LEHGAASGFQASGGRSRSDGAQLAYNHVGPGYFHTMRTMVLAGREFERNDRDRSVCIVNETAAKRLFSSGQAIGESVRCISGNTNRMPAIPSRIIGVVADSKFGNFRETAPPAIYFPVTKEAIAVHGNFTFFIRAEHQADAIDAYRAAASEIVPTIPVVRFATLQQQMDDIFGRERLIVVMNNFFGGLALLLSAVGLYGLLSSSVTQRTGEMGVRLALGAPRESVQWMILKEALGLFATGVVLGGAILYAATRFIHTLLYKISGFDPATLLGSLALLAAVAFLAAFIPARRASRVDPITALRCE